MAKRKRKRGVKSNSSTTSGSPNYVISVDVGVVNFAFCIVDTVTATILACENRKVCEFKGSKDYVMMCETVMGYFSEFVDVSEWNKTDLVIERQMKSGIMRLFALAMEVDWLHRSGHRAIIVSPITVKRHFGTSTGNYTSNKAAAVKLMPRLCVKYPTIHTKWISICKAHDKIDDLADAIIQSFYFIETMRS